MSDTNPAPFRPRVVLMMLVFGALAFLLTLYFIGTGQTGGDTNNGGAHVGGQGLTGYAAWADLLERRGYNVVRSRDAGALRRPGLIILTPPHHADGEELQAVVDRRRFQGPTIVVLAKWQAAQLPDYYEGAKKGWVAIPTADTPRWEGFADDVAVAIGEAKSWRSESLVGPLPQPGKVQAARPGSHLVPLARATASQAVLAAFRADGGYYPRLQAMAGLRSQSTGDRGEFYPVIFVFEPDLVNNYGLASRENAFFAVMLAEAAGARSGPVTFDMTLNGLGRTANLLTIAFTPPFLAATLCLLIVGVIVAWRAFIRFGSPLREERAIALGKEHLVANTAGFIRRTGRLHLLAEPYAELLRARIAKALGLPPHGDAAETDLAIDRALRSRGIDAQAFPALVDRLKAARNSHEALRAANDLKQVERTLSQ